MDQLERGFFRNESEQQPEDRDSPPRVSGPSGKRGRRVARLRHRIVLARGESIVLWESALHV